MPVESVKVLENTGEKHFPLRAKKWQNRPFRPKNKAEIPHENRRGGSRIVSAEKVFRRSRDQRIPMGISEAIEAERSSFGVKLSALGRGVVVSKNRGSPCPFLSPVSAIPSDFLFRQPSLEKAVRRSLQPSKRVDMFAVMPLWRQAGEAACVNLR